MHENNFLFHVDQFIQLFRFSPTKVAEFVSSTMYQIYYSSKFHIDSHAITLIHNMLAFRNKRDASVVCPAQACMSTWLTVHRNTNDEHVYAGRRMLHVCYDIARILWLTVIAWADIYAKFTRWSRKRSSIPQNSPFHWLDGVVALSIW